MHADYSVRLNSTLGNSNGNNAFVIKTTIFRVLTNTGKLYKLFQFGKIRESENFTENLVHWGKVREILI